MKRFTVLAVCCLLLAGFANGQKKSTSKNNSKSSARKSSPVVRAPKPLPAPKMRSLPVTQTPEMGEQLRNLTSQPTFTGPPKFVPAPNWQQIPTATVANSAPLRNECLKHVPKDPTVRCVTSNEVYVRSDPGSFFINTLKAGEHFRVRARRNVNGKCYYYGDAMGGLDLHNVWVSCDGLDDLNAHPTPRQAVKGEFHQSGTKAPESVVTTRDYFKERFGTVLPEDPNHRNGAWLVKPALGNRFDPSLNSVEIFAKRDPKTHQLTDSLGRIDFNKVRALLKARSIFRDGNAVAVDVIRPGQTNGNGQWAFVNRDRIRFVKPVKK